MNNKHHFTTAWWFLLWVVIVSVMSPEAISTDAYVITDPMPIVQVEASMIYILHDKEIGK
jgi:hypothetical protein